MDDLINNVIESIKGGASVVQLEDDKYSCLVEVTTEEFGEFYTLKLGYADVHDLEGEILNKETEYLCDKLDEYIKEYNNEQRIKLAEWADQKDYETLGGKYAYK